MAQHQEEVERKGGRAARSTLWQVIWSAWALLLALAALSRFAASLVWPIDLLACVSYFAAPVALLSAAAALWRRRLVMAALLAGLALTAAWPVRFMLLPAAARRAVAGDRHEVRLLVVNVHGSKSALDRLIALIGRVKPDAAVVIEVSPGLEGYLTEHDVVREALPFAIGPERGMLWRDILLSRHPLHRLRFDGDFERYKFVYAYRRSCFVDKPEGRFLLTGAHPPSPRDAESWTRGNELTHLLAEVSREFLLPAGAPVVIGGDFNSTPSGHRHRIMLNGSGLRPVDELGGLSGTWPSDWPGPLRLTIDRVWGGPEVKFISREVLEDIGSDHRPILITLSLPRGDGR